MSPDEGPYFQSAQEAPHAAAIEALWDSGALYACACTREEIDERTRQRAAAGDPTPGYDGYCRDLGLPRGDGRALRFRTPDEGVVEVHDLVRGDVEFPQRALEDFICVKGNGKPLFVLANAVDDRTMAISHVIRGEDLLPTTPRQIMLWGALNRAEGTDLALPAYAHLPLLVNEQGKKLSKRRDPVAVEMYREQGYLPEAFRNYLALLGWSPGDEEIVPIGGDPGAVPVWRTCSGRRPSSTSRSSRTWTASTSAPCRWTTSWRRRARGSTPCRGSGRRGAGATPTPGRPPCRRRPGPPNASTPPLFAALAAVTQERVTVLGEVPELVDFLFLEDAAGRPGQLAEGDRRRRGRAEDPGRRAGRLRDVPVGQGRAPRGDAGHRGGGRAQAGQGAGADPRRRHGPNPRASRCSTRWPCSAAPRRAAGWRPRWPA